MGFDLRRCAEAAVHAALAEAFTRPDQKRSKRAGRRRRRPLRALLRLARLMLTAVGLVSTVRFVLDPERRRETFEMLADRFPIEDLLEEIAVEVDAARTAVANAAADASEAAGGAAPTDVKAAGQRRRRPVARSRGDSNGQRGRKPPNRGTRAA